VSSPKTATDGEHADFMYPSAIPFVLVHLACIAVFWSGLTWQSVTMCAVLYWLRIFAIGAGYHRYFSHCYHHRSTGFPSAATIASVPGNGGKSERSPRWALDLVV
jgi:fatty-acid desaturase